MTSRMTTRSRREILHTASATLFLTGGFAGCLDGPDSEDDPYVDDEPNYGDWFDNVDNYEGTVDKTGEDEVTVEVGTGEDAVHFDPPAIQVDHLATVIWEWTGDGGTHNVVHEPKTSDEELKFESKLTDEAGHTFEYTFNHEQINKYYCEPHREQGMKGAVTVIH